MALAAEKISFSYHKTPVLQDFSLRLERSDFTMLLGANGSGKSTAVKLMGGYLKPSAGTVVCDNCMLEKMHSFERARKIAVVSQSAVPILDFTVREMVTMGRLAHSSRLAPVNSEDRDIVENAMAELEILPFADRMIGSLSGGERQRTLLAQALAQEPEYLLLDEPTSALDPAHALALMRFLRRLEGKIGILMVCHDLNLAWNYAKKAVILNRGRISLCGNTHEVLTAENISVNFNCGAVIHPDEGIILK